MQAKKLICVKRHRTCIVQLKQRNMFFIVKLTYVENNSILCEVYLHFLLFSLLINLSGIFQINRFVVQSIK